jgi:hypothetical protein
MPPLDSYGATFINPLGQQATYAATALAVTPVASATKPFFTIQGSSSKVIWVVSVDFFMKAATGSATVPDIILYRYSAMSGGTAATALVASQNDVNDAAATAVVQYWTTLNTSVTVSPSGASPLAAIGYSDQTSSATIVGPVPYTFFFGQQGKPLILRGTADWLGLCISAIGTTPLVDISVAWIEV